MAKPAYQFVDNIRCIAMLSIVTEHTSYIGSYVYTPDSATFWAYLTSIQLVKFGTISFFIIAGFLFTENSGRYSVFEYLKRRFDNIFKPWLIWSLVFLIVMMAWPTIQAFRSGTSLRLIASSLWWGTKTVYLFSNYWFIANFFFCTTVLLLSKRIIRSWVFGLVLFLMTSFYSINVYTEWIMPLHTTAIFGFTFFYWLGVQFHTHLATIEKIFNRISRRWFVFLTGVTLFIAVREAAYLYSINSTDPINTLRVSNIIFSISVFALLLRIKNFSWLSILEPRKTTYGIFLIHYILVYSILPLIRGELSTLELGSFTIMDMYKYQFTRFFLVYCLTFGLVKLIQSSRFSWIIGANNTKLSQTIEPPIQVAAQERRIAVETEAA